MRAEELITHVKSRASQWGQLIAHEKYSSADLAKVIAYFESTDPDTFIQHASERDAVIIAEQKQKIAQLHGKIGGLQKTVNKATEALEKYQNTQANNKRLARISSYAHDFIEEVGEDDCLTVYPTYIRLAAEFTK